MQLILVINPGSTSTKLAVYDGEKLLQDQTIRHTDSELKRFSTINQQIGFRQKLILEFLRIHHFSLTSFKAIVARGGLLRPIHSGTYLVNQRMLQDLASGKYGSHASNLGGLIACALAKPRKLPAYIVDPVVVDELDEIARISGTKLIARKVIFHALNQKAVARRYADSIKRPYTSLNLIVCHLGGGITVGWHHHGKVIDVNDGLGGDGPFSPERAGGVPAFGLIDLCFEQKMSKSQIKKALVGQGGLYSYLGTSDARKIEDQAHQHNSKANFYLKAMCYQVVKEIGALYFIANGQIDQLIITGGLAHSKLIIKYLMTYLKGLIKITIYPGEDEMSALMLGAKRILDKTEKAQRY